MNHSHAHHDHSPRSFNRAFAIAVSCNLLFTLAQVYYAYLANSLSLAADAAHNFGDVLGLILAWGANWMLTLPFRKRYSYGFKRITILAAILNALILFATSALISYESFYKLLHLSQVNEGIVIAVALIGILINGGSALLFMRGAHDDLNIKGAFLHLMSDALISIGVVLAGILIYFTGKVWIDPIAGLCIIVIILWSTWGLLRDSVSLIIDAIPRHINYQAVLDYFKKIPGVQDLHDLHIWGLSTKEIALTVHLVMPDKALSDQDYQDIDLALWKQFKINHATIQVEKGNTTFPCRKSEAC